MLPSAGPLRAQASWSGSVVFGIFLAGTTSGGLRSSVQQVTSRPCLPRADAHFSHRLPACISADWFPPPAASGVSSSDLTPQAINVLQNRFQFSTGSARDPLHPLSSVDDWAWAVPSAAAATATRRPRVGRPWLPTISRRKALSARAVIIPAQRCNSAFFLFITARQTTVAQTRLN